jgi:YVTN family beta-propeller protein
MRCERQPPRVSFSSVAKIALLISLLAPACSGNGTTSGGLHDSLIAIPLGWGGLYPDSVAVNETSNRVYVGTSGTDRVLVIDGTTSTVVASVAVGNRPQDIAVNPLTNLVYVANEGSNTISVIDGPSNSVVSTINLPDHPQHVAVNPNTDILYVSDWLNTSIWVIDGKTNALKSTIAVGEGLGSAGPSGGLAVNPTANRLYWADTRIGGVAVIDGENNTVSTNIKLGHVGFLVTNIAVDPRTGLIFAAARTSSTGIAEQGEGGASLQWTGTVSVIDGGRPC